MTSDTFSASEKNDSKASLLPETESQHGLQESECKNASFLGAVFNLSTTIVGAGIMGLPATMKILGLVPGISLIVLVGILTYASIEILLRFSRACKVSSYGGVMGDAFGPLGRVVLQICIIINTLGILIVYMIIIGDVVSGTSANGMHHFGILEEWFGVCWWTGRPVTLFLTTIFILVPLVSFRHVDSLKVTSALSVALSVLFVMITACILILKLLSGNINMPRLLPKVVDQTSLWKLFTAVPVLITSYLCHFNVHPIHRELKTSSQIQAIVKASLTLCGAIYITTSLFGYTLFGDQTMDDVLANFDRNLGVPYSNILNDIVRISYAVHLMLVFPVINFSLRLNLDGLIFPLGRPISSDIRRFVFITTGLVVIIFFGAVVIPSIWVALQFTGATAAVCVSFIFPGAIALRDTHGISTRIDKFIALFMIILGGISCSIALYSDIDQLSKKSSIVPTTPTS
ncbi:amino acid transporter AVT6A [Cryptomeria japonica]|uniref:amino acid transporter AVT6A n=1 Tax=Cryptomeria japonica TaxID=3369 RepID=UPI0027D9F584|nr:amino acid transporter AVT6A [Cryptomeria japonica]XP_057872185.2 amino acid transporter AVT6A [Cryptomeria japonica]XP_057872186.2 amino acid transporter AVT6A [Cryptomeria japonica]XP_057872188.2 amino acid transporter AVT6A [Cryptomeria japonica]XP_057872189.2 amino acid transporter AVT6A [Cryptomeria japonica]XP_057872190.2 amino acid transporter AVT6A [Cryptomeria japonica]XP_057872191.2 amino acid transporter AVT6A [Cryptomeria japonica]XP_057872193.2 amino acid transporter AVT6A [C